MKVCEIGDSLCMEVGKPDLSIKRRKKAMKTPRRRNLRLRIGWDLGLIFFFKKKSGCLNVKGETETQGEIFKNWVLLWSFECWE